MSAQLRPVQTSLFVGEERSVGPLPQSVVLGDNSTLIASIAPIYLTGSVLDVTYGRGMWWRRFAPETFAHHDLVGDGVDFRNLPHADDSWDAVCFDPPYVPSRAPHTTGPGIRGDYRAAYGLKVPRTKAELQALVADGLAECARVSRKWVLAKCCDYAENERTFVLGHVSTILAGEACGLRVHDLIVHAGGAGPGGARITEVRRARRAHSYLVVFAKRRRRAANSQPEPER